MRKSPYAFLIAWLSTCLFCLGAGSWNGVAVTGWNGIAVTAWNGTGVSVGGGATYLVDEGAEGTGPGSWTDSGATNWDDTTPTPPTGCGSQSLYLYATATNITTTTPTFTTTTDTHLFFRLYITTLPSGSGRDFFTFRSSTTIRETVKLNAAGTLAIMGGSATVGAMSTGTWYYLWAGYNASTGNSYVTFSSTSTKPSSGDDYTTAAQAGTADVDNIRFFSDFLTTAGPELNIDHILVDDVAILNDP